MKNQSYTFMLLSVVLFAACSGGGQKKATSEEPKSAFTGAKGEVKIMTLDPGHFHAALVQKEMYEQVDPTVYVYAPEGEDVQDHLNRIEGFNTRAENPTNWVEKVYTGDDYLERMLTEKPGNVMMVSGNNAKKIDYIKAAADAGINIYADKPMAINSEGFAMLEEAFKAAEANGVLLYDIMTERYEITTIIQRELSKIPEVFGQLQDGTAEEPAITKESVHHIFKYVAGNPIKRPDWFFDTEQQGEGMVDVTTHLVDMIQWEAFPEQILQKSDVEMVNASRWTTGLTLDQFQKVTQKDAFPDFLQKDVVDGKLQVYTNGEFTYKLKGKYAKVSVIWNFQAPEGTGDTHYSIMRGSLCDVIIKQGAEQNYKPTVYIQAKIDEGLETFEGGLQKAVNQDIATKYPGLKLVKLEDKLWTVEIPDTYKVGHEAHFAQVTEKYLRYLEWGKLPEWEVPNMITKYYTTTQALEMAKK
ncbi:putative oxidoreductase C-terminal domain-containing protein [uncultured Sunxiuqinia sp.]|uniref:putative oxidoreductase C-terminal domain-containing protein n=1 Tax=uncultured Sunxiuqinia sp. TaxID=1573825 RepID=UPI00260BE26A|nr:putative oxidoreductase C-terminal domain-containing protein [uncultured Sunxiuqinia sp.]